MQEPPRRPRRIAVIGSGIGGLTAAWLLRRQPGNEITLFEQHARPGMGVFGVDYTSRGLTTRIDIPTRVFCEGYYPQLFGLLDAIGVRMQATDHAAAYADADGRVFFHYGNANVLGRSLSYLRPTAGGPWRQAQSLRIARDSLRFFSRARRDLQDDDAPDAPLAHVTLGEYLDTRDYSERFVRGVLLPTLSVICTCDVDSVLDYPADLVLGYLTSGVMKQGVMRAELGVESIVSRMVEGVTLVCGVEVRGIAPASNKKQGGYAVLTGDGASQVFDRIVLATQAHQAASIVEQTAPATSALLRRVPFERSVMRVHTDERVLPRAWSRGLSPVTYHVAKNAPRPEVTVDMTQAFSTYRRQQRVFQTWNPLRDVREERVLAEATFTRPLVTHDSRRAAGELRRLQGEGETAPELLFCGAYMGDRVPLLEAAVESAVAAAMRLGARAPWSEIV